MSDFPFILTPVPACEFINFNKLTPPTHCDFINFNKLTSGDFINFNKLTQKQTASCRPQNLATGVYKHANPWMRQSLILATEGYKARDRDVVYSIAIGGDFVTVVGTYGVLLMDAESSALMS
jgi:hypothetical protein